MLHSIILSAGGANATATVYDETSGSGDVLAVLTSVANASQSALLDVAFGVGCYVTISGTGALFEGMCPICVGLERLKDYCVGVPASDLMLVL